MTALHPRAPYKFLDPTQPPFEPNAANTNLVNYRLPPLPDLGVPPLPEIPDKNLERQVFTHSSFIQRARKAASLETELRIEDNEKLEHVGDSIINATVTLLLHQLFPQLQVGGATILKGHLVSNLSLSQMSKYYELPSRIRASASEVWNLQAGEKVQANLFEAYVAALYTSYLGPAYNTPPEPSTSTSPSQFNFPPSPHPQTADAQGRAFAQVGYWLKPLFAPLCHWLLEEIRIEQRRLELVQSGTHEDSHIDSLAVGATARLNEYMTKFHKTVPEYPSCRAGSDNWLVSCTAVDKQGRVYASQATRPTKKQAGNIAAYKICLEMGL